MPAALMILLQATGSASDAPPLGEFDLRQVSRENGLQLGIRRSCTSDDSDTIVVCGSRSDEQYRLRPLPGDFEAEPLLAETDLGGGVTGRITVDSATMPDGQISKRAMIKVITKF